MNIPNPNLTYLLIVVNLWLVIWKYNFYLKNLWWILTQKIDQRIDLIHGKISKTSTNLESILRDVKNLRLQQSLSQHLDDDTLVLCLEKCGQLITHTYGIKPYKSQFQTALSLFRGYNVELPTGEGKTVALLMASFLSYMAHRKVFILTINDYLVKREYQWAQKFWKHLNIEVVGLTSDMSEDNFKQTLKAYSSPEVITYVNNQKIIFDFLEGLSDKGWMHHEVFNSQIYCDEIDLVLIDNVTSPFVMSAQSCDTEYRMLHIAYDIFQLMKKDYHFILENQSEVNITEEGYRLIEEILINEGEIQLPSELYSDEKGRYLIFIKECIMAHYKMKKNIDYLVKGDRIYVLNELTGRIEYGKNFNYPMNAILEMKEQVSFSQHLSVNVSVFYQSFFNLFRWKSGTTGTLIEARREFSNMYDQVCVKVRPRHVSRMLVKNIVRADSYFRSGEWMSEEIKKYHKRGMPVLVIASDMFYLNVLENYLKEASLTYERLDATNIEEEDRIIAKAGLKDKITLSTNVTGRGVDILLGGDLEEKEQVQDYDLLVESIRKERKWLNVKGGLVVFAVGMNLNNRIDRQLQGRCARQGYRGVVQPVIHFKDQTVREKMNFPIDYVNRLGRFLGPELLKSFMQRVISFNSANTRLHQYRDNLVSFQHYHSFRDCKRVINLTNTLLNMHNYRDIKNPNLIKYNLINNITQILSSLGLEGFDHKLLFYLSSNNETLKGIKLALLTRLNDHLAAWSAAYHCQQQSVRNYAFLRSIYQEPVQMIFNEMEDIKSLIVTEFANRYKGILLGSHCGIQGS